MSKNSLETMSTDELWALRERVAAALAERLAAKMRMLDSRLRQLQSRKRIDDPRIEDAA
jgi:hypothetical protein